MSTKPSDLPADVSTLMDYATAFFEAEDGSAEENLGLDALWRLRRLASREVFEAAKAACASPDVLRRRTGASVLGDLGAAQHSAGPLFGEERYQILAALLAEEMAGRRDPILLREICFALGHLHDARAIPAVLTLRQHPDDCVRYSVVHALSRYDDERAIDGLIELSTDSDGIVRDWATFGLGSLISTDTPAIRAALHARLNDTDPYAQNEAIEGLIRRRDPCVIPTVARELRWRVTHDLLYAAERIASPQLCEALMTAADRGLTMEEDGTVFDLTETWQAAMQACGCTVGGTERALNRPGI